MTTRIPDNYISCLDLYDTQAAIALIKRTFQDTISSLLSLKRVSAPLAIDPLTGMNDNLTGRERPVAFDVPGIAREAEIVQSLAKWKRYALYKYNFYEGRGLYADMNAIRRDEELDNLHSIYVDQWDWEKIITEKNRNRHYLHTVVRTIVRSIAFTGQVVKAKYPDLIAPDINDNVSFITSQELLELYPDETPQRREYLYSKEHGTVFIEGIGWPLSDGKPHDKRSPDYDDWNLNGDIIFYYPLLDCAFEISSMGIRVDSASLSSQLKASGCEKRATLMYHKMVADNTLPLTIGGGIGQSRLCMILMGKVHIGEVQASVWDEQTVTTCKRAGVMLL
jgi:aspartate--ammonia ligase